METDNKATGFFSQFPKDFWVVNSLELFERGAYYGTMAVWSAHANKNLGISESVIGLLYALLIIMLYFIPLISAALAEKYGYKKVLSSAFSILIIGYILNFTIIPGSLGLFFLALVFWGVGAGAFKPIISASIAHITREEQRNLAYSIYYWMINLGAFLLPLSIHFFLGAQSLWAFVFLVSAAMIGVNLAITFLLYSDPVKSKPELSLDKAIRRIIPALKDRKFIILLLIYSGFWFMFAMNHSFLPIYMLDFHRLPPVFSVPLLATINPGTIILTGPFLGKLVEKYKSLNTVMLGIIIFSTGLIIIGFSNNPFLFVLGIIVFSFGEFITHPGFIAYVSKLAPKDMVAIYMACIFIATGTGNAVGGAVQGFWYEHFAVNLGTPKVYFALVVAVGLLTLICFILYNRWIIGERIKIEPTAVVDTSIWTKPVTIGVVLMFIPLTVGAAYIGGANTYYGDEDELDGEFTWADFDTGSDIIQESGSTNEGSDTELEITIDQVNLAWIHFNLSWTDEPDLVLRNNQPDTFSMEVVTPGGNTIKSKALSGGSIDIPLKLEPEKDPYDADTGTYNVKITCIDAGDQEPIGGPNLGFTDEDDIGNTWNLQVEYSFYESKS